MPLPQRLGSSITPTLGASIGNTAIATRGTAGTLAATLPAEIAGAAGSATITGASRALQAAPRSAITLTEIQ
jgi:hypothetical protein